MWITNDRRLGEAPRALYWSIREKC